MYNYKRGLLPGKSRRCAIVLVNIGHIVYKTIFSDFITFFFLVKMQHTRCCLVI